MKLQTIAIFSALPLEWLGGVEKYSLNLSKTFLKLGFKVLLITSNIYNKPFRENKEDIDIFYLPCLKLLNGRFPILKYGKLLSNINKLLINENIDYIIVNNRFYLHSLYGVQFAHNNNLPVIVIEHASGHFSIDNPLFDMIGHLYEHLITFIIRKYHPVFCGVSLQCINWLKHYHIYASEIFSNAVNISEIENIINSNAHKYRKEFNIPNNVIVVCFVGRLLLLKGIRKLIESINLLNMRDKKIFLFIAGSGEMEDYIKQNLNKYIIFLGQLNYIDVLILLNECNIFCLPTDYPEGFPTSILEAVACNCFCISTLNSGAQQLIFNEEYGILLKENTIKKISEAIEYASNSEEYRNNAIKLTKNILVNNYSWNITANGIINFFKQIEDHYE